MSKKENLAYHNEAFIHLQFIFIVSKYQNTQWGPNLLAIIKLTALLNITHEFFN